MLTINPVKLIAKNKKHITFGENQNNNVKLNQANTSAVDNKNLTIDTFQKVNKQPKTQDNISGLKKAYKIFFTREYDKQIQEKSYIHLPYMA